MNPVVLTARLNVGRLSRADVEKMVGELLDSPQCVKVLLEEILNGGREGHFHASWVLDRLMRRKLEYLLPHIEEFTLLLPQLKNESCIRCLSHICEMLCTAPFEKDGDRYRQGIDQGQWERILTVCYDWLIAPMGIAPKVFAMTSLYHLGLKFPWVHPELKAVLEDSYAKGSSGYQNRAKKTLGLLARTAP